ncbi:MAG: MotA/TolQ/ExbB proton channel family protein [Planctomycetaceae bacterium]
MNAVLEFLGLAIYVLQALSALFGVFMGVLMVRKIAQRRMSRGQGEGFLDEVQNLLGKKDFDGVAELCDSPPYWSKAVPQLVLVAMANRQLGPTKLHGLMSEKFERDVLSELAYQQSWITTVIKSAPMLGLMGTVEGMILAFAKIATASQSGGINPADLANDISFALLTTLYGLAIAVPLTVLSNWVQVRIGKMTDEVQEQTTEFLSDLTNAMKH